MGKWVQDEVACGAKEKKKYPFLFVIVYMNLGPLRVHCDSQDVDNISKFKTYIMNNISESFMSLFLLCYSSLQTKCRLRRRSREVRYYK